MSKHHRVARGIAALAVLGLAGIAITSATAGAATGSS
jgi:hypothetical protein